MAGDRDEAVIYYKWTFDADQVKHYIIHKKGFDPEALNDDFLYEEMIMDKNKISAEQKDSLIQTLKARFEKNSARHHGADWKKVEERLNAAGEKLTALHAMETSGGEPDLFMLDTETGEALFMDFSPESPAGRRSLCYDQAALAARKENKPAGSAQGMADEMGIELLTEAEYRALQKMTRLDTKTSSWIATPADIRKLGGALFANWHYGHVFTYYNGAESYYAARGFRGKLRL